MNKVNIGGETSSFIGFFSGVFNCLWECYCLQNLTEIPWSTHIYMACGECQKEENEPLCLNIIFTWYLVVSCTLTPLWYHVIWGWGSATMAQ